MTTNKSTVDQQLIRDLAHILDETNLTEIEVEQNDMRVRVSRQSAGAVHYAPQAPASAPAPLPPAAPISRPAGQRPERGAKPCPRAMVGTAYSGRSTWRQKPFIEVGQTVKEGQTLLIIEAMKTMNQIPSTRSGTVTAILCEDGQPVGVSASRWWSSNKDRGRLDVSQKILIANRRRNRLAGAARRPRTREIKTVGRPFDGGAEAMHVRLADESVCIGPASLARQLSQHSPDRRGLRDHRERTPSILGGYGFLSENAKFAEILGSHHNITFIGPRDRAHSG